MNRCNNYPSNNEVFENIHLKALITPVILHQVFNSKKMEVLKVHCKWEKMLLKENIQYVVWNSDKDH